jgi:molybdopterin converting factor small subunit
MNTNFYLKDPNSKGETNILLFFSYKGKRLKYYTGVNVLPKQWSKAKQIIYSGVPNSEALNKQLRDLKTKLEDEYLQQINIEVIPPPSYFKDFLNNRLKDEEVEADSFAAIYEAFKKDKSKVNQPNSIKRFNALYKHFLEIEKYYNIKISIHTFTKDFYQKFIDYFVIKEAQTNNTIKDKHLKSLHTFLNWLVDKGYIEKNHFKGIKFPYKVNPADTISLSEEELNRLYLLDLTENKRLEQVRDVFCIECYTGLRYSDTKKFKIIK